MDRQAMKITLFSAMAALCVWPRVDAAMALGGGMVFSLALGIRPRR